MPIEIQELIITATISPENTTPSTPAATPVGTAGVTAEVKEEIISECIRQVLEIMHKQNER